MVTWQFEVQNCSKFVSDSESHDLFLDTRDCDLDVYFKLWTRNGNEATTTTHTTTSNTRRDGQGTWTRDASVSRALGTFLFICFFTYYTNVFIRISYYRSTTAMNDAIGGRERGRGSRRRRVVSTPRYVFYSFLHAILKFL
jgi:hypothetical protein